MVYAPEIDPVLLSAGGLELRWYGLMYLAAAAAFWIIGRRRARETWRGVDATVVDDMVFYGMLGAVVGGRLAYVVFYAEWSAFAADPWLPLKIWRGGMSFHGGVVGVVAALWMLARARGLPLLRLTDFAAPLVPLGLAFGRVGNFVNGELWGRETDAPWAMVFRHVDAAPRHPSQLYEAALEGVLLFVVLYVFSRRLRRPGEVSAWFALGYAAARFTVEFFREPDAHIGFIAWGWLTLGHALTLPLAAIGVVLLVRSRAAEQGAGDIARRPP